MSLQRLPLDDRDRSALLNASVKPPVGSLVVVEGSAALLAATALGECWSQDPSDLVRLEPDQARWTAEETRSIISLSMRTPQHRHVIVLASGEAFRPSQFDQLLKTFEEPPAPCWFLLAVPDRTQLPPAVRSRAALVLSARPSSRADRVEHLVRAGVEHATARDIVQACAGRVELEVAAGQDPQVAPALLELVDLRAGGANPLARAHQAAGLVDSLASALADQAGSKSAGQRTATELLIAHWRDGARHALRARPDEPLSPGVLEKVTAFLGATDAALLALERNVAPAAVIASVTTAA
jgi:hypothetical protein